MTRMLQVRNLPDEVHDRLKARAKAERMTLSDFVARELSELVRYRSNVDVWERARELAPRVPTEDIVAAVREGREE